MAGTPHHVPSSSKSKGRGVCTNSLMVVTWASLAKAAAKQKLFKGQGRKNLPYNGCSPCAKSELLRGIEGDPRHGLSSPRTDLGDPNIAHFAQYTKVVKYFEVSRAPLSTHCALEGPEGAPGTSNRLCRTWGDGLGGRQWCGGSSGIARYFFQRRTTSGPGPR